jgi:hypothetical protein
LCLPYRSDETKALSRQRFDEALFLTGIAYRAPGGIQARGERGIGHDTAVPNGVDKVVLADNTLPVADQVFEQIEHLWSDGDDIRPAVQFAPISIECVLVEEIAQIANPSGSLRLQGGAPAPLRAQE